MKQYINRTHLNVQEECLRDHFIHARITRKLRYVEVDGDVVNDKKTPLHHADAPVHFFNRSRCLDFDTKKKAKRNKIDMKEGAMLLNNSEELVIENISDVNESPSVFSPSADS